MNFSSKIIGWYLENKRDLPWRKTKDPYKIWLSEIILQQTRIEQGLNYYLRFTDKFPDIKSLAQADEQQVLKLWQGLGYYSRARNMLTTARFITDKFNGSFPAHYADILDLKGIGEYTAAAIVSFAYNQAYPVMDGNVMRFLARLYGIKSTINSTEGKQQIYKILLDLIDHKRPGEFNQAIMEFGALQCKPQNPDCQNCIFQSDCIAHKKGIVSDIPVRLKIRNKRKRYFHYFLLMHHGQLYLNKRISKDIWRNLYDFPHIESNRFFSKKHLADEFSRYFNTSLNSVRISNNSGVYKHLLTHQQIFARFYEVQFQDNEQFLKIKMLNGNQFICIDIHAIHQYPLPRLIDKYVLENQII